MRKKLKSVGTSVKFDAMLHARLAKAAKRQGCSISELIRITIAASLGHCPACGRAAKRAPA